MRRAALFIVLVAAIVFAVPHKVLAGAAVFRSFDGPQLTWQLGDGRPGAAVLAHGCVDDDARQGSGSERVVIAAPAGESLHFICPVGRIPVLDEFESRLWVKTNRPGVTLAARVVLPRSIDASAGNPRTVLIPGGQCDAEDRWQQLKLSNLPKLLDAQARILRMKPGTQIDAREAYVDAIVLVVPGGAGSTAVWTDALEVDGVVMPAVAESSDAPQVVPAVAPVTTRAVGWQKKSAAPNAVPGPGPPLVQFQGTMLMVAGKPFVPLGVEWNNEPLEYLAARGCNTIWTDEPPTRELSDEAARAGVWLICPPPSPDDIANSGLGDALDRVLAWNLGSPAGPQELDYFRRWADLVRERDSLSTRPIVMMPRGDWLPASRLADALVADHAATSRLSAADFAEWLQGISLLARPATPFWASIPTQPGERARQQTAALARAKSTSPSILDDAQIESLVTAAAISGCRGVVFRSDSPLDATDDVTRQRAVLLETYNNQLDLVSPWLTAGKPIGEATSTDASANAIVLQVERARLLIPTSWGSSAKDTGSSSSIVFVVPGIPESNEAFLLSGVSLEALPAKRVAGGMRIVFDRSERGLVLMTEDPAVITSFRQQVARGARRAAQLEYSLAATRARALSGIAPQLSRLGVSTKNLDKAIGAANADIAQANSLLTAGNFAASYQRSSNARRLLAEAIVDERLNDADSLPLNSAPFGTSLDTLLPQTEFDKSLSALRGGENQLVGGDFEDLGQLRHFGWQHIDDPVAGVETRVELSGQGPHEGRYCLELSATAVPAGTAPQIVGRPLVWITSPPIRATARDVIEISGWVRVTQPIAGAIEGLEVIDSLGGQELALRVRNTTDWQPFRIIRSATVTTDVTVTFALHGVGSACVDGVMVRALAAPSAKRLPTVTTRPKATFPSDARRSMFAPPLAR